MSYALSPCAVCDYLAPFYDLIQDPILAADAATLTICYANPAAEQVLGQRQDQLIDRPLSALLDLTRCAGLSVVAQRLNAHPALHAGRIVTARGQRLPATIALQRHTATELPLVLCAVHLAPGASQPQLDQLAAQQALAHSEARYRHLVKAIPDLIFRVRRDGTFLDHEESPMGLLRVPDEFLHRRVADVMPDTIASDFMTAVEHSFERSEPQTFQYRLAVDEHTPLRDYEARVIPQPGPTADSVIVLVRDVTEQVQAQRAQQRLHERYEALIRAAADLIFVLDEHGIYQKYYIPEELGLPQPTKLVGQSMADLLPPDIAATAYARLEAVLATGNVQSFDYSLPEVDGLHHYECRFVRTGAREVHAIVRDMTARQKAEETLRRQASLMQGVAQAASCLLLPGDYRDSIQSALRIVGEAVGVSYAALLTVGHDPQTGQPTVSSQAGWSAPGVRPFADFQHTFQDIPWQTLHIPRWYDVLARGEPIVAWHPFDMLPPAERAALTRIPSQSLAVVPIHQNERLWGLLAFDDITRARIWDEDELNLLHTMAASLGAAVQRYHAEQELKEKRDVETTLRQIGTVLNSSLNLPDVLAHLLSEIKRVVHYDTASVLLLRNGRAEVVYGSGYDAFTSTPEAVLDVSFEVEQAVFIQRIIQTRQPYVCSRVRGDPGWIPVEASNWIESWLGVPIVLHGESVIGLFSLDSVTPDYYTEKEANFVHLIAQQAAVAIENARLYQQLRDQVTRADHLFRASEQILATLNLDEIGNRFVAALRQMAPDAVVLVCDYDAVHQRARVQRIAPGANVADPPVTDMILDIQPGTTFAVSSPAFQAMLAVQHHIDFSESMLERHFPALHNPALQHVFCVPLRQHDQLSGFCLIGERAGTPPLTDEDRQTLVSLAQQAAVATGQARLFAELKALEGEKSDMIRMASHDLRSPLARVKGYLAHLLHAPDALTDVQHTYLTNVEHAISDMQKIVNDLLSLERITAHQRVNLPIKWCELIDQAVASVTPELDERDHALTIDCSPNTPITTGDPTRLRQAIVNLLSNAIKYTPPGGRITVRAFLRYYGSKPFVWIEVEDNGIGIPETQQPDLFQPFYRALHENAAAIPGLGLGLSTVKSTVTHHRGTVYFRSTPGEGSTFGFRLPVLDD